MNKTATHIGTYVIESVKSGRSSRAKIVRLWCKFAECPILAQGMCIIDFMRPCRYGYQMPEIGPTTRSKRYSKFIEHGRAEAQKFPRPKTWPDRIAYIGEYVYLPYAHMNHREGGWIKYENESYGHIQEPLPFVSHSGFMLTGSYFMPREKFTVETIQLIVEWRPQSIPGSEIVSYQKEELPRFLRDLKIHDRKLYNMAVEKYPKIAELTPDNTKLLGRHAKLNMLPDGKVEISGHVYQWDSKNGTLTTTEDVVFMAPDPIKIVIYPHPDLEVKLCDPDMLKSLPDTK